jgi:hypothetical protein
MIDLTSSPEWVALTKHFDDVHDLHLRQLFSQDAERATRMTAGAGELVLDYSKHRITDETLPLLIALARTTGVEARRDAMFSGAHINTTEDRAVLHVALRMPEGEVLTVDGQDVVSEVPTVWEICPIASATDRGWGPPESGSAPWSTSVSADPTWVPPWPPTRWPTTPRPNS